MARSAGAVPMPAPLGVGLQIGGAKDPIRQLGPGDGQVDGDVGPVDRPAIFVAHDAGDRRARLHPQRELGRQLEGSFTPPPEIVDRHQTRLGASQPEAVDLRPPLHLEACLAGQIGGHVPFQPLAIDLAAEMDFGFRDRPPAVVDRHQGHAGLRRVGIVGHGGCGARRCAIASLGVRRRLAGRQCNRDAGRRLAGSDCVGRRAAFARRILAGTAQVALVGQAFVGRDLVERSRPIGRSPSQGDSADQARQRNDHQHGAERGPASQRCRKNPAFQSFDASADVGALGHRHARGPPQGQNADRQPGQNPAIGDRVAQVIGRHRIADRVARRGMGQANPPGQRMEPPHGSQRVNHQLPGDVLAAQMRQLVEQNRGQLVREFSLALHARDQNHRPPDPHDARAADLVGGHHLGARGQPSSRAIWPA